MPNKLRLPHTSTATRLQSTPLARELLYDDDENAVYYGDGTTAGGVLLAGSSFSSAWGNIGGNIADQTDLQTALGAKFTTPSGTTSQYVRGDGSLATFPTTFSTAWGNITGTLADQTDLKNALDAKFNSPSGTASQYIRGDGTLGTFPTSLGTTWGNITGTLSSQTDLQNALNAKFSTPAGTTSQYVRGDGSLATFPTISTTVNTYGSFFSVSPTVKNIPLFTATRATTINELRGVNTSNGTATISIQINGVNVTGLTNLAVTSTPQNFTATSANTVAVGARVTVNITAVSGASDLEFTMGATLG